MIQRAWGQVKSELSETAGITGLAVTDPRMLRSVNNAIQELMNEGDFPGVVDLWHVIVNDGHIVLPPQLDTLLAFTADGVPQQIMAPWAEFVNYGPGPQEDLIGRRNRRTWFRCGTGDLYERGESPVMVDLPVSSGSSCVCTNGTGTELDGPWTLRQYANPATDEAAGAYSTIQGLDENGLLVRSTITSGTGVEWINGIRLEITSGSSFVESTQQFSKITAYTKPETNGYVRLTAWNGTTEVELSNYEPWETEPSYHKYFSPFLQARRNDTNRCCRVVLARARRRFVPVKEDTDVLIISNINALEAMIVALWKRKAGAYDEYAIMKTTAVDILKKESVAYQGKGKTPALTFQKGFSLGELPAIR